MQFLFPGFLWALGLLAIPIVLHLFYFRRFRKVYFTNVRFLKEVKDETSARSRLRNLLVLAARLLAVGSLVLAFAQPFIPRDTEVKQGPKAVSIFLDNSFSMAAQSQDLSLMDKARQRAQQIIAAYSVEDRFQILTNDFEGRHQRLVSQEDALAMVDEIALSPTVRTLSQVINRQKQTLRNAATETQVSYIISDFQRNIADIEQPSDTTLQVNLVPLTAVQERNVSIDSAWFEAPVQLLNQTNPLIVKVSNRSNEDADNIRLSIRHDGQAKPVGTLNIPAQSSALDTVNITILHTGRHRGELEITDYPIQFDDHYFLSFDVAEEIPVLLIHENTPDPYLESAFKSMSNFKVVNQLSRNIDYNGLPDFKLVVLHELPAISSGLSAGLTQYLRNGGNVLIFPAANANTGTYNSFLGPLPANELGAFETQERTVGSVNFEEFIFRGVFQNKSTNLRLPVTKGNFRLSRTGGRGEEILLTYRDGSSFLSKYQIGGGNLYFSSAPLSEQYNNLISSGEIFVPMLYKMAVSEGQAKPTAYTIGKNEVIALESHSGQGEIVYKLKGTEEEFIPEQRIVASKLYLSFRNPLKTAGFYDLFLDPQEPLSTLAFNYDRRESQMEYLSGDDLGALAGPNIAILPATAQADLSAIVGERSQGVVLWRWFLIAALAFLALEVLLLRFWKV